MLWINQPAAPWAELPFGGIRDSGYGGEGGQALEAYLNTNGGDDQRLAFSTGVAVGRALPPCATCRERRNLTLRWSSLRANPCAAQRGASATNHRQEADGNHNADDAGWQQRPRSPASVWSQ